MGILFDDIVFGPVRSRRLGLSLGINLLPPDAKICTFNCVYCECGWTQSAAAPESRFISRNQIRNALEIGFSDLARRSVIPNALTFAGNGEPTLHPEFPDIVDEVLDLRDQFFPGCRVVVLSNSSTLGDERVFSALMKTDCIMKLDAGTEEVFSLINHSLTGVSLDEIVTNLMRFNGNLTVQTLLLKGERNGKTFDNSSGAELEKWLAHISRIKPRLVMLYPIDRSAPVGQLEKMSPEIIESVAGKVRQMGIDVRTYT